MTIKKTVMVALGFMAPLTLLDAQTEKERRVNFGMDYATEMQTNFRAVNWVNQLHLCADANLGKGFSLEFGSYSIAKTREERLINDYQVFSNIEEENLPFAFAMLGIGWNYKGTNLFIGVRNVNEDYFTSPITSHFTNSSCGIFPTISANYDIANYPLASLGVDFRQTWGDWQLQASVYNGQGYNAFKTSDNPFIFHPKNDGVFGITAINYAPGESHYNLGCALHVASGATGCAPWASVEQRIGKRFHLLAQGSVNFAKEWECRDYEAIGLVVRASNSETGIIFNHANFTEAHEWATELTSKVQINQNLFLQPALHLIRTGKTLNAVGLFRLVCSL